MANRSNGAELERRAEAAAELLASGIPRTAAVSQLAERFNVERRTARRYVARGLDLLAEEIGSADLAQAMAETVERLRRLSWEAQQRGNLAAAVGAEKAAAHVVVSLYRTDILTAARLAGHTVAAVEPPEEPELPEEPEPSEHQRRRYRRTISAIEPPF